MLKKENNFEKIVALLNAIQKSPDWVSMDTSEVLGGMGEDDVDYGYEFYNEKKDEAISFVINYKYKNAYMKKISKKELTFWTKEKAIAFMLTNKNTKSKTKRKEAVVALLQQVEQNSDWQLVETFAYKIEERSPDVIVKTRYYNKVTKEAVEFCISENSKKASYKSCKLAGFNIFDLETVALQSGMKM